MSNQHPRARGALFAIGFHQALADVVLDYIQTAYQAAAERGRPEPIIPGRDVLEYLDQHTIKAGTAHRYTARQWRGLVHRVLDKLVAVGVLETSLASGRTGAEVRAYNPREAR